MRIYPFEFYMSSGEQQDEGLPPRDLRAPGGRGRGLSQLAQLGACQLQGNAESFIR